MPVDSAAPHEVVLATASDDRFAAGGATALLSAAKATERPLPCVFVGFDLSERVQERLRDIFAKQAVELTIVEVDSASYSHMPVNRHFSAAMYGRLSIPALLRDVARQTLYLDPDTLTVDSVSHLLATNLRGQAVAAVQSERIPLVSSRTGVPWRHLGIPPATAYMHSGVLLIDNEAWCVQNVTERALEVLATRPEELVYPDQDALNAALAGRWIPVGGRWNVLVPRSLSFRLRSHVISRHRPEDLDRHSILHFAGIVKPWDPSYAPSAYRRLYCSAQRRLGVTFDIPKYWSPLRWIRARP